jgi:hypothetical protein
MTHPRPSLGGTDSHDLLEANPRGRGSQDSLEAILERETQSRLARGQPQTEDVLMTRSRPTSDGRHSHDGSGPSPGEIRSHDSSEAKTGQETQSRLAQGHPRAGQAFTTCPWPTPGGR